MIAEDLLKFTRNHSSEIRAILLYIDTTLNTYAEGHIAECDIDSLKDTCNIIKTKADDMKGAIGDLE